MQLGKLTFKKDYFDLDELLREVVEAIQLTTQNHIISVSGKGGKVYGDKDRIDQVINLLINAIKYSPDADRAIVNLTNQKKIFERFFQANGNPDKTSGLGIGLYISTKIIKRHGGNNLVQSEKGKGSTFSLPIPSVVN